MAVLIEDDYSDEDDVFDALFGTVSYRVPVADNTRERTIHPVRQRDGPWFAPGGPSNRRVSAVVTAINLQPSFVARGAPRIWHNPWAARPLGDDLVWRTIRADPAVDSIEDRPARAHPADLLQLAADWPGPEDPFPDD